MQVDSADSRFVQGVSRLSSKELNPRIRKLFGDDGIQLMAQSLRCTPERFSYAKPRGAVVATIELLEVLAQNSFPPDRWPTRWLGPANATRLTAAELSPVFERLIGRTAMIARLAAVLELRQETVHMAFKGRSERAVQDIGAVAELLDALSGASLAHLWPARWASINDSVQMSRSTRRPPREILPEAGLVRSRIAITLGGKFPSARFARAIGRSSDYLSRIWRGEMDSSGRKAQVQPSLVAIIELLEALKREGIPLDRWPERWRQR